MKAPDEPIDENARLDAVSSLGLLDTAPEERFDRITRLARRLFRVPTALVTLIDSDRQWFKSADGLGARELPRETSFCGHAILGDDAFCIPDATRDSRFADNPLVVGEPHIAFYAGCPIWSSSGHKVGTLCIMDRRKRTELDAEERADLFDLAALVEHELRVIELATTDVLTGLLNRRGFITQAEHSLILCARAGLAASLIFIDLNDFKAINDAQGHAAGDAALRAFADCLRATVRDCDLCGRFGGDEFLILLTGKPDEQPEPMIDRLEGNLAALDGVEFGGARLDFSYGVVQFDASSFGQLRSLLEEADRRMYAAKSRGRDGDPAA